MQQTQDPRATVIRNVAQDQYLIEQVIKQIPPIQKITLDILVQLYDKCPQIREEPQFIQVIFNKNTIYEQFIMWLLQPTKIIQKRQKNPENIPIEDWKRKYPYTCLCIAKDNNSFYINLYLKTYFDESAISLWFQFLKDPKPDTIYTSLGYFTEIMLPFIKFQFSQSTKICETLSDSCDEDVLICSSEFQRQQTSVGKQRQFISKQKKRSFLEDQISVLKIFSDQLIENIFDFIEYEVVFKFVHNLILVSLQQSDLKRSKRVFEAFLKRALQISTPQNTEIQIHASIFQKDPIMDICIQYIFQAFSEIYDNANTQKNYRVIFFIDSIIRVHLINVLIQRMQNSFLMVKQSQEEKLTSSCDFSAIIAEESILEYYIKSLSLLIKIFSKMMKYSTKTQQQLLRQSKYYGQEENIQDQVSGQQKVMTQFSLQIQIIFQKLPELSILIKKSQSRALAFSSGQNIKPITLCKYEFFQLIYNCLTLSKEHPDVFIVDTEKINLFIIIQRYLKQNRWNNIAHQILEKIACILVKNNKNFYRTKQMSKNNMADEFLNSIIQSFTNKKYIFLNSLRFTTQGNLHTLYTIAKGIINQLKQSHKLANLMHEFQYYKKFVVNDLQSYQAMIKQNKYPADEEQLRKSKSLEDADEIKLFVDEISVSQIVKKIQNVTKWPKKQRRRKHGSFIQRSLSYTSDQFLPNSMLMSAAEKRKGAISPSQQLLNQDQDDQNSEDNININKTKSFYPKDKLAHKNGVTRQFIKSDVKSTLSKSIEINSRNTPFIKIVKKADSIQFDQLKEQSPERNPGKGLFAPKDETQLNHSQYPQMTLSYSPTKQTQQLLSINIFSSQTKPKRQISIQQQVEQCQEGTPTYVKSLSKEWSSNKLSEISQSNQKTSNSKTNKRLFQ